jgi:hypothetical protein
MVFGLDGITGVWAGRYYWCLGWTVLLVFVLDGITGVLIFKAKKCNNKNLFLKVQNLNHNTNLQFLFHL